MQDTGRVVQLAVYLVSDAGLTVRHVVPNATSKGRAIDWGGMGDMTYQMRLEEDGIVEVIVLVSYFHDVDERTLMTSIVVHFVPHGWVKLKDVTIPLDRDAEATQLDIPGDIVEEKLNTTPRSNDNIESIYGKRLDNRDSILRFHNRFDRPKATTTVKRQRLEEPDKEDEGVSSPVGPTLPTLPDEFNSFTRQRELEARQEQEWAAKLAEEWEWPLKKFIGGLFGNPERVREIVRLWHRRLIPVATTTTTTTLPPGGKDVISEGSTPIHIFFAFMNSLLHAARMLELTETHLYLFNPATAPTLGIARTWLTTDEQIFCNRLFVNRAHLFQRRHESDPSSSASNRQYRLYKFRLDQLVVQTSFCPRFIVHQFALDCADCAVRSCRPIVLLTFIAAAGRLYVKDPRDPFVARLKIALEKPSIQTAIAEMGMFVRIGLSPEAIPHYEPVIFLKKNGHPGGNGQCTPFRLTTATPN